MMQTARDGEGGDVIVAILKRLVLDIITVVVIQTEVNMQGDRIKVNARVMVERL